MSGLGEELWQTIVTDIEGLADLGCYEPVSDAISLYIAPKLRVLAAAAISRILGRRPALIADVGCGPGTSTAVVRALYPDVTIVAVDPAPRNLAKVISKVSGTGAVQGVFEGLPIRDRVLDGVIAMFSFRDAASHVRALDEFSRVLKDDGVLVVLDLYRPENPLELAASIAHFKFLGPAIGLAAGCGKAGLRFSDITDTVLHMMTPTQLLAEASRRFRWARFRAMPALVGILVAKGPRRAS